MIDEIKFLQAWKYELTRIIDGVERRIKQLKKLKETKDGD